MSEFNPMKFKVSDGGGLPTGNYTARFVTAEHLPAADGDPMTGKGGRKFEAIRFSWEILTGEHAGKMATCETPNSTGVKSRFYVVATWLMGKPPQPGEDGDLSPFVGKKYLLTLGNRPGKQWVEVVNAMLSPTQ